MIAYFSGTGNSRYASAYLGKLLGEECYFIPELMREPSQFSDDEATSLILVTPVYCWGVPPIVERFIATLPKDFKERLVINQVHVNVVFTCGDETGLAPENVIKILINNGLEVGCIRSVIMPNDYVLLPGFNVDPKDVEQSKLDAAPSQLLHIAKDIKCNAEGIDVVRGSWPRLKTKLLFPLFKKWGIFPNKWHWTAECVSCGRCAQVCPVKNISMVNDHPRWGKDCTSCLGCYNVCPTHAVAYGNLTNGKGQYFLKTSSWRK